MKIVVGPYESYTESYTPAEHRVLYDALLYYNENVDHINKQTGGNWDGYASVYELSGGKGKFKTGFLERIVGALTAANVFFEIEDTRVFPKPYIDIGDTTLDLRPYQQKVLSEIANEPMGFIKQACGAGKTPQSVALFAFILKVRTLVVVDRILLMKQSYKSYKEFAPNVTVGRIGGGYCELDCDLTIAVVNTISGKLKKKDSAMTEFIKNTEALIIDEAHIATSKSFLSILELCQTPVRYGLSATPNRRDEYSNLLAEGLYGPIRSETFADELMDDGYLSKVFIRFEDVDFPDRPALRKIRSKKEAMERLIYYNHFRNQKICKISKGLIGVGDQSIVIFKYRHHGDAILEVFRDEFSELKVDIMDGQTSVSERERMIKEYVDGTLDVLLTSFIFAVGVSINKIPAIIYAAGMKPESSYIQIAGRLSRVDEDKVAGLLFDFNDNTNHLLLEDSNERKKIIESEPGYKII